MTSSIILARAAKGPTLHKLHEPMDVLITHNGVPIWGGRATPSADGDFSLPADLEIPAGATVTLTHETPFPPVVA